MAMNKVKINSDVELKDRLVAINRGVLARQVKSPPLSPRVLSQQRRTLSRFPY